MWPIAAENILVGLRPPNLLCATGQAVLIRGKPEEAEAQRALAPGGAALQPALDRGGVFLIVPIRLKRQHGEQRAAVEFRLWQR